MEQIHTGLSTFLNPTSGFVWVLTIVILVVLMRLLLVPLFIKQMHATRKMSALAPQIQELRKKYKNDKQTLNQETMRLYKENGANPLAGCLPLLGQLPLVLRAVQRPAGDLGLAPRADPALRAQLTRSWCPAQHATSSAPPSPTSSCSRPPPRSTPRSSS
jgi:hypothetical protein